MILEKVWAKINENYEQIIGGLTLEVLHDFTGAPVESIYTNSYTSSELWDILFKANKQKYIMCCGAVGQGKKKIIKKK